MRILVCIKQVPGTTQVEVDPVTGVLKRDGVAAKLNPYDLFALEAAFALKETHSGEVVTLSMGPDQAKAALLETLYMGADAAVLLSDRRFAGADVLATSYALSQGIRCLGEFDLILCGKQTTDGDTAQVGAEIAEFMGLDHAANVVAIDVQPRVVEVELNLDHCIQRQRMALPCLLCVDKDINMPRLPSYRRKLATDPDAVRVLSMADLSDNTSAHYGLDGSPTQVERIFPPQSNTQRQMFQGEALGGQLFAVLQQGKFL